MVKEMAAKERIAKEYKNMDKRIEGMRWLISLIRRRKRFVTHCVGGANGFLVERGFTLRQRLAVLHQFVALVSSRRNEIWKIIEEATEEDLEFRKTRIKELAAGMESSLLKRNRLPEDLAWEFIESSAVIFSQELQTKTKIGKRKVSGWLQKILNKKLDSWLEELKDSHKVAQMVEEYQREMAAEQETRQETLKPNKIAGLITGVKKKSP